MSNDCSNHKKDLFGQTDMKVVARSIVDLHYETLAELFGEIEKAFLEDYVKDKNADKLKVAMCLWDSSIDSGSIKQNIENAYEISKPFMNQTPDNGK